MTIPPTDSIRILLVDDHAIVRAGLQMLLDAEPPLKVVGTAENGAVALEIATREQPDIILLDLDLGNESGIDLLPALLSAAPSARVILLTGARDAEQHLRAVQLGAMGVVLKDQAAETLREAVQKVHAGSAWLDPALTGRLLTSRPGTQKESNPEAAKITSLTEREHEIVALICEGLDNNAIGKQLHISPTTVRNHLATIFSKLDVTSRLELAIYAFRHGLAKPMKE